MPFEDSRRLTGSNLFFASTGAVLELVGVAPDDSLVAGWRERVERAREVLGWQARRGAGGPSVAPELLVRPHQRGASFALAAPCDQLFTATEVNEWALCATLVARDPQHWAGLEQAMLAALMLDNDGVEPADPPVLGEPAAMARLRRLAAAEARPALRQVLVAASAHRLSHVLDDDELTLGSGAGSITWRLDSLPDPNAVQWATLRDVPTALVTGSNGKTTTVRLIAACAREQGSVPGYNCTDGIVIDGVTVEPGDYAGPVGARRVLRDARVGTVVIEAARGGILRRGLAPGCAQVAVVTNVSADHFGEYGIDDLAALADVKLTVGRVLLPGGLLVLNADDPTLVGRAPGLGARYGREPRIGWFALDADVPLLVEHRGRGGWTCGPRAGRLELHDGARTHDLGPVAAMPIAVGGSAVYNVANLAAAALASVALGATPAAVARVLGRFGADPDDNPGRLMRYGVRGATVLVDYAHNPAGLAGLLDVARHLGGSGRVAVLLGHAGNRRNADFDEVARVVAERAPDYVVVKEDEAHLRGREPGEIPRLLRASLLAHGMPGAAIAMCDSELDAVRHAFAWARTGDVLVLPVHSSVARAATLELIRGLGQ